MRRDSAVRGYLDYLTHERRMSAHTARNYERDLHALVTLAEGKPWASVHSHDVRRYIARLHARGLTGRTLARMLSAWRGFYRYLARDHGVTHNPCLDIRAPKSPKRLPHALSPDQAAQLMSIEAHDALALRDKAIFELFYSSGLRLSELTALGLPDVNFHDATVRLTGKGSKTRVVPVGSFASRALQAWLEVRAQLTAPEQSALFVSRDGARLSARAVQQRLKVWSLKLGVPSDVHPHVLRHSFASHVLQSSGDLRAVQEMLGHASISTTQIYTHLDHQYLSKVYDQAHPRAKRKA